MRAPILQALQPETKLPFLDQIKAAAAAFKGISNPQQYIENEMMKNNPMIQSVIQEIQNNGGNAQAAFYNYAQKCGIDPNEILNALNGK